MAADSRKRQKKITLKKYRCPACKKIIEREPYPGFLTPSGLYISYCGKNGSKRVLMRPVSTKK